MTNEERKAALEAIIYAADEPATIEQLAGALGEEKLVVQAALDRRLITTAGRKEVMGRPILYKSSKEFLMRFGLSDLDELPSLREFEALAREALGSDAGVAAGAQTEEEMMNASCADTLENLPLPEDAAAEKELIEEEVAATNEGMPAGELDEQPPKAETATAGE